MNKRLVVKLLAVSIFLGGIIFVYQIRFDAPMVLSGITFTPAYANYLGLNPQETFQKIITDLHPKIIRLSVAWNEIETRRGIFIWDDINWYLTTAQKNDVGVVLVIGRRTPRWPECHEPAWLKELSYSEQRLALNRVIKLTVERFKDSPALVMWQVENEPFLSGFGKCPIMSVADVQNEITLVRAGDSQHPIMITDSGELSTWLQSAKLGDYFGTTLYRTVWSERWQKSFSYWFVPPFFYRLKAALNGISAGRFFVAELQAEPWGGMGTERVAPFVPEDILKNYDFARATGAQAIFLWGAEYWYAQKNAGDGRWVDFAQRTLRFP